MRVALAALMLLVPFSTSALAQDDAMEVQRCVWRCLAESRGADDPAYQACINKQCNGPAPAEDSPATQGHWVPARNVPYPAVTECATDNFCLLVSCPERRAMSIELYAVENSWAAGDRVSLQFADAAFDFVLPQRDARDMFSWPLPADLNHSLKSGASVTVDVDGNDFGISLSGSASAIRNVENRCR